ncbi:MAG: DMT family transporter [Pseudorhodoplanes sp.]|nr:DMT family transporter [Pseudorhodoplanes sp.]
MELDEEQYGVEQRRARRGRLTGIALMCAALACFSCLDTTAKYLNYHMDTMQVVWARYMSAFVLAFFLFNPMSHPGMLRTRKPVMQVGRSALLLGSTAFNFYALKYLQLDQVLSILFATPLLVAAMAGPILGEWIGWRRWVAIVVGFCGVLLVTRPGAGGIHPAAFLAIGGTLCYAVYVVSTRILSRYDSNETTLFYSNLVGAALMSFVVPFVWTTPENLFIMFLMVVCGAFGSFGHYMLIAGHRLAPASTLAPFIYTQIVWTTALGFLVFGDIPNSWTIAGAVIVISSGLYLLYRERTVGPRAAA